VNVQARLMQMGGGGDWEVVDSGCVGRKGCGEAGNGKLKNSTRTSIISVSFPSHSSLRVRTSRTIQLKEFSRPGRNTFLGRN